MMTSRALTYKETTSEMSFCSVFSCFIQLENRRTNRNPGFSSTVLEKNTNLSHFRFNFISNYF